MESKIKILRVIAYLEGWSFLVLLFIAMPLKYIVGLAIATKIIGMFHGILFIWFCVALFGAAKEYQFGFKITLMAFISSLIPLGTFIFDRKLKNYDDNKELFSSDNN